MKVGEKGHEETPAGYGNSPHSRSSPTTTWSVSREQHIER